MKFKFRFASVLKLRRHQEKMEKQKLADLFSKKNELQDQLTDLQKRCRANTPEEPTQSVAKNRRHYAQKHAWHKQLAHIRLQISEVAANIEKQRKELAQANMQTKMMERLQQNEKRAFIQRAEEIEQLQQNEIAIQRYNAN